jgi:hypothetical protein
VPKDRSRELFLAEGDYEQYAKYIWLGRSQQDIRDIGVAGLPGLALAQTAATVNDQIKQLQKEIQNIQKQYQSKRSVRSACR